MNRTIPAVCAATAMTIMLAASGAMAEEHTVSQAAKKFDQKKLTVKSGDTVAFVNNDDVSHNVYSRSDANTFDLKLQEPGQSNAVAFNTPGKVKVRCAIHPKMKLTVSVVE